MKKSNLRVYVLTCITALLLLGCATLPTGFEFTKEKVVRHMYSGMEFPPQVSDFYRKSVKTFDEVGRDVGVNYRQSRSARCVITFYIYPAYATLEKHTAELKGVIKSQQPGAKFVSESEMIHEHSGVSYPGRAFVYTYEEMHQRDVAGLPLKSIEAFESRTYLFIYKDWFMKYRITYPQRFRDKIDIHVSSFMEQLVWP